MNFHSVLRKLGPFCLLVMSEYKYSKINFSHVIVHLVICIMNDVRGDFLLMRQSSSARAVNTPHLLMLVTGRNAKHVRI